LRRSRTIACGLVTAAFLCGSAARGEEDDWYWREPPLALPQGLNGVIRPPRDGEGGDPARLERIADVFRAFRGCWRRPSAEASGQQVTVRLSFKRNGEVLGKPRITFYQARGDAQTRERFRSSVLAALQSCTPLPLSDALGSTIAGRPFTLRFVDDQPL
jgi:hypothetical protein